MAGERAAFLSQMVEVLTSTVSFGERLNNMVHLLARNLKVDLALYFGLDKAKETLILNLSSQGPVPPHMRVEFALGQGLVGVLAGTLRQALLQEEAKKRIAELSVLFEVGKALSATMELNELLERVVNTTAKVITARGAALQIIDATTKEVRVSSKYGEIPLACPSPSEILATTAPSGELPHLQGQEINAAGQTHYFLAVPLTFKGQLQGTSC